MQRTEIKKSIFTKTNAAALAVFLFLAGLLILSAIMGWISEDECYYYADARRFANGDKVFFDDIGFTQLTMLFLSVPCQLYVSIVGSTDGLILFMRLMYIAADLGVYWFCVSRFREKGIPGVVAAALFCLHPLAGVLSLNYYNVCLLCVAVLITILFYRKKELTRKALVVSGILYALAVACEPVAAAIYCIYTMFVFVRLPIRRKRTEKPEVRSVFDIQSWLFITLGVASVAAAVLLYLAVTTGIGNVISFIPAMFRLNPYDAALTEQLHRKFEYLVEKFGVIHCVLLPASTAAAAVVGILFRKRTDSAAGKLCVFLFACASTVSAYIYMFAHIDPFNGLEALLRGAAFPVFFFAATCFFLCREKDPRDAAALIAALLFSLPMDLSSNFTLLANGSLAYFPAVFCAASFLSRTREELFSREETKEKTRAGRNGFSGSKAVMRVCAAAVCAAAVCEIAALTLQLTISLVRDGHSDSAIVECTTGPGKGIYEPETYVQKKERIKTDAETIREICTGSLCVALERSYCYLAADLPVGSYAPMFHEDDLDRRVLDFWEIRPEKRPQIIYVSDVENDINFQLRTIEKLQRLCECEINRGKNGYIIRVLEWYD